MSEASIGFNKDSFDEWYRHVDEVLEKNEIKHPNPGEVGAVPVRLTTEIENPPSN